ncbi:MAG: hypothetical protein ABIG95_01245 [Candidatus Woesearchaeota archaeon]
MATILDLTLLKHFVPVFSIILIFAITYGVLQFVKVFGGENKNLHAIIALMVALFFVFSGDAMLFVQKILPVFVIMIIFIMVLLMGLRFAFGVEGGDQMLLKVFGDSAGTWVVIAVVLIFLITLGTLLAPRQLPRSGELTSANSTSRTDTTNWETNVVNLVYHPMFVGMIAVLVIMALAIKLLTK